METRLDEGSDLDRQLLGTARKFLEPLLVVGLLAFLARYAYVRWTEVRTIELALSVPLAAVGSVLLVGFYAAFSRTWQRILIMVDGKPEGAAALELDRAFLTAFVTRYLPAGNVLTIGGRVELLNRLGGRRSLGLESVYYEQLYLTVGAFLWGLAAYLAGGPRILPPLWWSQLAWLLAGVTAVGTIIVAAGPEKVLRVVIRVFRIDRLEHLGTRLTTGDKVELTIRFVLINALQGGAAFFFLWSVYPALDASIPLMLAAFAAYPLSRFVGQAAAIIPGGLGIREGAYTFLLGALMPVQPVLISAGLVRLLSVLIELLLLGALFLFAKVKGQAQAST